MLPMRLHAVVSSIYIYMNIDDVLQECTRVNNNIGLTRTGLVDPKPVRKTLSCGADGLTGRSRSVQK